MNSSPITLSKDDTNQITTILIVLEEEFVRSHGDPINIMRVIYNDTFKKLAEDNRFVNTRKEDIVYVRGFLEELIKNEKRLKDRYYVEWVDRAERRKDEEPTMKIVRKNKYNIKSDKELKQLINQHPGGLEVNDELLNFTYKKVHDDLDRLYKENTFRKLMKEKSKYNYLIFPKKEENELEIYHNEHKEFDFRKYLELCASINARQPEKEVAENSRKSSHKKNLPDPNYQLDNYQELKQEWLKRNKK